MPALFSRFSSPMLASPLYRNDLFTVLPLFSSLRPPWVRDHRTLRVYPSTATCYRVSFCFPFFFPAQTLLCSVSLMSITIEFAFFRPTLSLTFNRACALFNVLRWVPLKLGTSFVFLFPRRGCSGPSVFPNRGRSFLFF